MGDVVAARPGTEGGAFTGAAGHLLDELLSTIGLRRSDVLITGLRAEAADGNREPRAGEIAAGVAAVLEQLEAAAPRVICTIGNAATRALREDPAPIDGLHGRPEPRWLAGHPVHLVPLHHPAAALYSPGLVDMLRRDIAALPEVIARPRPAIGPPAPEPSSEGESDDAAEPAATAEAVSEAPSGNDEPEPDELRLF